MRKHIAIFLTAVMLLMVFFSFGITARAANVTFNITPEPSEMVSGGNVTFVFNVTSDTAYPDCKIFYNNSPVSGGSIGNLIPDNPVESSFVMNVTDSMLGKDLTFEVRSEDSAVIASKKVKVNKKTLSIVLGATVTPSRTLASAGDTVQLNVTVQNQGETTLTDITVRASGIASGALATPFQLNPGQSRSFTHNYRMESRDISFTPTIDYKANGVSQPRKSLDPITITLESRQVSAVAEVDKPNPLFGEEVTLKLTLTNSGNVSYTNINVMMNGEGVSFPSRLNAGDTASQEYKRSFQMTTEVVFTVTLRDHTGQDRFIDSNKVTIRLPVDPDGIEQNVLFSMSADRTELSSAGVVNFSGFVNNNSEYTLSAIRVDEAGFGNIFSANELVPGQRLNIEWSPDINETTTYDFVLTLTDADGNPYTFRADPIAVTILSAEETPDFDDAAGLDPDDARDGLGTAGILMIIAGVLVLLIIGVGIVLFTMWKKGQGPKGKTRKAPPGRKRPQPPKGRSTAPKSYRDRNNF